VETYRENFTFSKEEIGKDGKYQARKFYFLKGNFCFPLFRFFPLIEKEVFGSKIK